MNPILWPGERFIVAYLFLAAILIALAYVLWFRSGRNARSAKMTELTEDPYRIAYLRGGASEAIRLAIFNLVDRSILTFDGSLVRARRERASDALRRPLDRALIKACANPQRLDRLLSNSTLRKAADEYASDLGGKGLISSGSDWMMRATYGWAATGLLAGVAIAKIVYAVGQGRSNIGFLAVAAIVTVIWMARLARKRRTFLGGRMLSSLRTLLKRLKDGSDRLKAGGSSNEALLLASAFGIYALPGDAFPMVEMMFPKPKASSSSDNDGSGDGGSSCSSSSCGGGGGCGGCGS